MAGSDTNDQAQPRANAEENAGPPPRRGKPLDTLVAVRREMAGIYWQLKHGQIDLEKGKGLVYVLGKIVEVIKADKPDDAQIRELVRLLRERAV